MAIELFEMERMQSTWENLVDYDMSESGVRPLTLRELVAMGFNLDEFLDQPLGYSQSNGTIELRERIAAIYPRRDGRPNRSHQRDVRSELPRRAEPAAIRATTSRWSCPTTCRCPASREVLAPMSMTFRLQQARGWEPDWEEFERALSSATAPRLHFQSQ